MSTKRLIRSFSEIGIDDLPLVGGNAPLIAFRGSPPGRAPDHALATAKQP
jgi:hypothetical protein